VDHAIVVFKFVAADDRRAEQEFHNNSSIGLGLS
jgi:hypothetical protein